MDYSFTLLILLLPLVTFFALGLLSTPLKPAMAGMIGTTNLLVITVIAYVTAYQYFFLKTGSAFLPVKAFNVLWLTFTDQLQIHLGILLDPLSVMMLVVITTVSFTVHIYSMGYMKGERGFQRYYAFLSLFTFSMLGLVVATNIFQMYIFWELVGVSSYLLIGFYYERPSAVAASKKAFIVTRFADLGFLIGILILSFNSNTFDFDILTDVSGPVVSQTPGALFLGLSATSWAMLFIFMGGAGKSAMFPLHIWLPGYFRSTFFHPLIRSRSLPTLGVLPLFLRRLSPAHNLISKECLPILHSRRSAI
jgi:NADH-quinone oxidoreductase subunit L